MISIVLPFFNQPNILETQLTEIANYPEGVQVIVVDDGSQVSPALPVFQKFPDTKAKLFRINEDIAWNLEGARNLGATVAETDWLIMTDIDHIFPAESMQKLLEYKLDRNKWYYFPRFRVGAADSTRQKDKIDPDAKHGKIHPHVNTYLITKEMYWSIGGNDEDYAGMIGGEAPFLRQLKKLYGAATLLPDSIYCNVYTRDKVKDANITTLSRDPEPYRRLLEIKGDVPAKNPLRFTWQRII